MHRSGLTFAFAAAVLVAGCANAPHNNVLLFGTDTKVAAYPVKQGVCLPHGCEVLPGKRVFIRQLLGTGHTARQAQCEL